MAKLEVEEARHFRASVITKNAEASTSGKTGAVETATTPRKEHTLVLFSIYTFLIV